MRTPLSAIGVEGVSVGRRPTATPSTPQICNPNHNKVIKIQLSSYDVFSMIWGEILPVSAEGSRRSERAGDCGGNMAEGDRGCDTAEGDRGGDTTEGECGGDKASDTANIYKFYFIFFYDCQQHEMYLKCYKRWKLFLDNFSWTLFFMKLLFGKWKMETFFLTGKKNQEKKREKFVISDGNFFLDNFYLENKWKSFIT